MSNKLYTEEEIRESLLKHQNASMFMSIEQIDYLISELTPIELPTDAICVNCDEQKPIHSICMDCIIKIGKQNIELPTDDEIEEFSHTKYIEVGDSRWFEPIKVGAKWMRDKIGGNNEQF